MDCSVCGASNREDAKFCAECGALQAGACAVCGGALWPAAKFCDECGTRVATVAAEAVRKTVTVLFCDLVGSTAFGDAVDPESAREAMGRYYEMVQSAVEDHGGTVVKFIGDGAMAVFGIPEVAEDDAGRAVAAGLELQRRFGSIAGHVLNRYGVEVGLRVGINTGEVVIADEDADIVGDALNTAARLEAACLPGQVLVGEDTWRLTRSIVKYEALGEVTAKGKAEPVATFRAIAESGAEDKSAVPFIGREAEIGELRRVFAEVLEDRAARMVTVIGPPGVGKTRLAFEMARQSADETTTFDLRCERSGTATFAPVAELLRSATDTPVYDNAEQAMAALRDLIDDAIPDRDRVIELLGSFVGAAAPRSTEEAFFAVRRLLEILAASRPVLLVVDDVQWAEPLFLDLLEHLVEWVKDAPVLIVALARPEIRELRPALVESGRRLHTVLAIEGLDAAATEALAAQLLGADALPPGLAARLPESTQGNPLFVRELIRMLIDDGVVSLTDVGWEMAVDADAVEVPPTIQSLLATRVERMPLPERHVAELASVVGSEFPRGSLRALDHDLSASDLDSVLEALRRKDVIEPTGAYWGDEPIFRFHHVLIRDAAYRRLLKEARADLHMAVGEWTERTATDLVGEYEAAIAFHFEQAHQYRAELGLADEKTAAIGERAAALMHVAASRALERDDLASAGGLARRALACLGTEDATRPELLLVACEALLGSGDVTEGRVVLDELDAAAGNDARLEAWAACFAAQLIIFNAPGQLSSADASAGAAAEALANLGDEAGVAKARQVRAGVLARLGRIGDCEAELDLALTAARAAGDRRRISAVLESAPVAALWGPSPVPRAGGRCLDVIRLLRITTSSPAVEAVSVRCQAVLEAFRGRFDTARTMLATAHATAEEIGLRHGLMETDLYHGIVELLAGEPAQAEPHLRSAYGGLGKLGIGADAGQAAAYLARALLAQGRFDEAEELAEASHALAGQNPQTRITALSARAEISSAKGQFDEAVGLAEQAVAAAAGSDILFDHASANVTLARVRAKAGDGVGAQQARVEASRLLELKGATIELGLGDRESLLDDMHAPVVDSGGGEEIDRSELFPEDQLDEVLARLDELAPAGEPSAIENEASRAACDFISALNQRRPVAELLAEDFVRGDRRSVVTVPSATRDEYIAEILETLYEVGATRWLVVPIALRTERYCLLELRIEFGDSGSVIELLAVGSVDAHGLISRLTLFDADDLPAAVAELDRLYLEQLDPAMAEIYRRYLRFEELCIAGDLEATLALFEPDAELIDHRALGFGPATMRERVSSLISSTESRFVFHTKIHRFDLGLQCATRRYLGTTTDGGHFAQPALTVTELDPASGLVSRAEQFGDDEIDRALTLCEDRLNTLVARSRPVNRATWVGAGLEVLARTGEVERFAEVVADSCVIELSDGSTRLAGPAEIRSGSVPIADLGFGGGARRLVAVREDRLALVGKGLLDGTPAFAIEEIDGDDRLCRVRHYAVDQLRDAGDRLNDRYVELLEAGAQPVPASLRVMRDWDRANNTYDVERKQELLADDFTQIDHRPLGLGTMDRARVLEMTVATRELPDVPIGPVIHRVTPHGMVSSFMAIVFAGDGDWTEAMPSIVVTHVDGQQLARIELFPEDQLDEALARFDELAPAGEPSAIENEASRAACEFISALNQRRPVAELLAEDFVREDRRSVVTVPSATRDEYIAEILETLYEVGATRWLVVPIALRTERYCLLELRIEFGDSGSVIELLAVGSVDAHGLISRLTLFDADDLPAAAAALDRLYLEQLDPAMAEIYRGLLRFDQLCNEGDLEGALALFDPDVEIVDYRELGFGPESTIRERISSLIESTRSRFIFNTRIHRLDYGLQCMSRRYVVTTNEGGHLTQDVLAVAEIDPATGLVSRVHQYGPDELSEALGRCDDHSTALAQRLAPVNRATWIGSQVERLAGAGDMEQFAEWVAEGCVVEHSDRPTRLVALAEIRSGSVSIADVGFGGGGRRLIAARGERLALVGIDRDDDTPAFAIEEIDHDDLLCRVTHYRLDQLRDAADRLNDRYLELLGAGDEAVPSSLRVMVAWDQANRAFDVARKRQVMSDDYQQVDHRPLGFGTMGRDAVLKATDALRDPSSVSIGGVLHVIAPHGIVTTFGVIELVGDTGWTEAVPSIVVCHVVGDKLARTELFPEDQLDEALARFGELRPAPRRRLENAATRSGDRHVELLVSGASTIPDDLFSPEFVHDDRRSILNSGVSSGAQAMTVSFGAHIPSPEEIRGRTLAIRGDRLALVHAHWDIADFALEFLAIESVDEQGRRDRTVLFDSDALGEAFEEIDRLYLDGEGAPWSERLSIAFELAAALNRGDTAALYEIVPRDLRVVDHRQMGWPDMDQQAFIELMTAHEALSRGIVGSIEIPRVGERSFVAINFSFIESADDFAELTWDYVTVSHVSTDDALLEYYSVADLDTAFARFDELENARD